MGNISVGHQRRSMRLKEYDYASAGAYFVTIVSYKRLNIFSSISNSKTKLTQIGEIVENTWREIHIHFPYVRLDSFVIMPNHIHGILNINIHVGARHASPLQNMPLTKKPRPLGVIVGSFKSSVTKRVHDSGLLKQKNIWQRNYYEHIIRDEDDYCKISEYIESNPVNWAFDHENIAR